MRIHGRLLAIFLITLSTGGWPLRGQDAPRSVDPRADRPSLPASSGPFDSLFVPVQADRIPALKRQFATLFHGRLRPTASDPHSWELLLHDGDPGVLRLRFDEGRGGIDVRGRSPEVVSMARLTRRLAEPPRDGTRIQILRLDRQHHDALRGAVRSLGSEKPRPLGGAGPLDQGFYRVPAGAFATERRATAVRQAAFQNPDAPVADDQPPAATAPQPKPAAEDSADPLQQIDGVEIESLPELDVIILRGRDPDLAKLADVIAELERISKETQPNIRLVPLQHAGSIAVAELINEVSEDLVGGRQGRVSVTPLVKPNALLLIGWGDAVKAIVQLARQLDTPVAPGSQFAVFRLQHASAATVGATVEEFFAGRVGLGTRAMVTIDARTNALIVSAAPRDLVEVAKLIDALDQPGGQLVHRTQVFPIRNALVADLAATLTAAISGQQQGLSIAVPGPDGGQLIKSGSLQQVTITPNVRNNSLVVTAPAESMDLVAALIERLDQPAGQVQLKIFKIVNGDASSMIDTLRSLLPTQTGGTASLQPPTTAEESSLLPLRFSVDLRSNSIIATGSEGDLRIVEALLLRLDQTTDQQRKSTVIQLKNAPAIEVASAINQFLFSRRQIEQSTPGAVNPFQEIEREVVVVPEPVANKLILAATPRYFEEIMRLIEKLDEQPPQVMIQVLIAEVALNSITEFGIEMGVQSSVLFDRSLLGDLVTTTNSTQTSTPGGVTTVTEELIRAASNVPGFLFNNINPLGNSGSATALGSAGVVGGQGISNFAVGRGNEQLGFGGLVLSASSRNVSVLLRALNECRHVRILSRPQVRTLDNQPAFIQVGQRVPRITGSTINEVGQTNNVELENVGLILGVTPRVSPDNTVVMEIDAEKSSLGSEQDGIPVAVSVDGTVIRSPRIDTTTAQATVSAANGETIILGGLIAEDRAGVHRRVPIIQDIPVLKHLFKFDSDQWARSELLIILTPHVIRSSEDNERLKHVEIARMHWCEADVYRVHGDINVTRIDYAEHIDSSSPPVVYPALNPTGELAPVEVAPVDVLPPASMTPLQQADELEPLLLEEPLP